MAVHQSMVTIQKRISPFYLTTMVLKKSNMMEGMLPKQELIFTNNMGWEIVLNQDMPF